MPNGVKGARLAAGYPYTATRFMVREMGTKTFVTGASFGYSQAKILTVAPSLTFSAFQWISRAGNAAVWSGCMDAGSGLIPGWYIFPWGGAPHQTGGVRLNTSAEDNQFKSLSANAAEVLRGHSWIHVGFIVDNGSVKLYLNGKLVLTGTVLMGAGFASLQTSLKLKNGAQKSVHETAFFNTATTDAEVEQYYYNGVFPQGALFRFKMDEGTGVPQDSSGNDFQPDNTTMTWSTLDCSPCRARSFA